MNFGRTGHRDWGTLANLKDQLSERLAGTDRKEGMEDIIWLEGPGGASRR
jgi:hypothetical protein